MRHVCLLMAGLALLLAATAQAETVAYWRFEEGLPGANMVTADDASGQGNPLYPESVGGIYGFIYADNPPFHVGQTGADNTLSAIASGANPGAGTNSASASPDGIDAETITPLAWTLEAVIKCASTDTGDRAIVCRASLGLNTAPGGNLARPSLYLQRKSGNGLACRFTDMAGVFNVANSGNNVVTTYDPATDPMGLTAPWYYIAAVSNGSTLNLYLAPEGGEYSLIASGNLTSADPRLSAGVDTHLAANNPNGIDYTTWHGGQWIVGHALWAGGVGSFFRSYVDEVRFSNEALPIHRLLAYDKLRAHNPTPADRETNVIPQAVTFNWNTALDANDPSLGINSDVVAHRFVRQHLADPNLWLPGVDIPAAGATGSYGPIDLVNDLDDYRWRVDEVLSDDSVIAGPVWTIDTLPGVPLITTQPASLAVSEGSPAIFSIDVLSITALAYEWKKVDPAGDITVGTDPALTIDPAGLADEAFYYCEVSNAAGTVASEHAGLAIARPLAHWPLDGNYLDISGQGNDANPVGTPSFVPGVAPDTLGQAAQISSTDGYATAGNWNPSQFSNQLSVSFWLYWNGPNGGYQTFLAKRDDEGPVADETHMWHVGSNLNADGIWFQSPSANITAPAVLQPDAWQHVAATFDGELARVYFNGELQASGDWALGSGADTVITIGAASGDLFPAAYFLSGALDDVRIYNYALSDLDVANEYHNITGNTVCVDSERPDVTLDLDGNCIVDMNDFATFVEGWLACGLVPDCLP